MYNTLKYFLALIPISLIFGYSHTMSGQDCLEYPPIDGAECVGCVPEGWEILGFTSPDIIPGDGTWPGGGCMIMELSGESPGGGNMVMFVGQSASGYEEGMTTTVSGLNTGQEYGFGLYWQNIAVNNCGTWSGGDLLVEVDGEAFEFSGADEWEFIEICFTPSSESIEISMNIITDGVGDNALVIDSPQCDQVSTCCPLKVEIEEEIVFICPGDPLVFPGSYEDEEGSVLIEWTSDPSEGVDFLDDPETLNPVFLVGDTENFEGESYVFRLTVEDDNCEKFREFEVEVLPSEVPEFDLYLCEVYEIPPFPTESLNGYTGFWEGNFDFDELGGTVQEYTFTLDPGQDNCIEEWTFEIPIDEAVELTFLIQQQYCVLDDERYRLPDESEERVEGEWNEDRIIPSDLGEGVFIFTFSPDVEEFCAFPYELEIEVFPSEEVSFNLPNSFCARSDTFYLPEISDEDIFGSWDEAFIDLNEVGSGTVEFTPEDINDCYSNFVYNYIIDASAEASFDIDTVLCASTDVFEPESTSIEGYEGFWTPGAVDFDSLQSLDFTMRWTPTETFNGCLEDTLISFSIQSNEQPVFELTDSLCQLFGRFTPPVESLNGISGIWTPSAFDTDTIIGSIVYLEFQSSSTDCPVTYSDSISIIRDAVAEFDFPVVLCAEADPVSISTVSLNNITGSWTVNPVDPASFDDSLEVQFIPDDSFCADTSSVTFYIEDIIIPEFNIPEILCSEDGNFIFPATSLNGIHGQWSIPEYIPQDYSSALVLNNSFEPDDPACYAPFSIEVELINFNDIMTELTNPTNCEDPNGAIRLTENYSSDFEYSIDGGVSWTNTQFDNLSSGNYEVLVRPVLYPDCVHAISLSLSSPESAVIDSIRLNNPSGCDNRDGIIECIATGSNLEYSIDGGASWQEEHIFLNLVPNIYTVLVRPAGLVACADSLDVIIEPFPDTRLIMIDQTELSDCGSNDASLSITAEGQNLEYSIDGGMTWQTDSVYNQLAAGSYVVIVRSADDQNCTESAVIDIESIDTPVIVSAESAGPSDCGLNDAAILITMSDNRMYEYSIDGGISWQETNAFDMLAGGLYTVLARLTDRPACRDMVELTIDEILPPAISTAELNQPTDCISSDGNIIITTDRTEVEYTIDGGMNWQGNGSFDGLSPGNYEVRIRPEGQLGCEIQYSFEVIRPQCPCNELTLSFDLEMPDCLNPISGSISITDVEGLFTGAPYTIVWNNGTEGPVNDNITEGWHSYIINYDLDCILSDSVYLESIEPVSFDLLSYDQDCEGLGIIEVVNLDGGSGMFQFSIDGLEFQDSSVFFNLSADAYEVLVSDAFNCDSSAVTTINDDSNLQLELPQIEPIELGESVTLNPLINASTIDNFEWSPQEGILNPGELVAVVAPQVTTEYVLTIYFGDCVEIRSITVEVIQPTGVYIPNVFNPNDRGNNKYFFPQASSRIDMNITFMNVYDRWGNLVFSNENFDPNDEGEGWDGYFNNQPAIPGVYVYQIEYEINGDTQQVAGSVTLLR